MTTPPAGPDAEYVAHTVRQGHVIGRTFEDVLRSARRDWGDDVDTAALRAVLAALAADGLVMPHPGMPHRYLHRDYLPSRPLATIDLPVSLAVLGGLYVDIARQHEGLRITSDHLYEYNDGQGRRIVVFDRPVHDLPPDASPFRLQGP
jgi:hypothetical protein